MALVAFDIGDAVGGIEPLLGYGGGDILMALGTGNQLFLLGKLGVPL